MAELRDKGAIPLTKPDVKIRGGIDPVTGYIFSVFLDFANHEATVWFEPTGYLPKQYYGTCELVDYDALPHDGHFKVLGHTWAQNHGEGGSDHFVVIDLGPIPR